jgi:hypothetical protein
VHEGDHEQNGDEDEGEGSDDLRLYDHERAPEDDP